jgi:6-phosphogluconolactonase
MTPELSMEVLETADAVANRAAQAIAALAKEAIEARGKFLFAVSGGHTPWVMLRALAAAKISWPAVRVFQVDERVAPAGDADRNLTHLKESLLEHAPLRPEQILAMPVEAGDLDRAAAEYAQTLQRECGSPAVLDLVHLGLGPDGHTASLVPGDPVLNVLDKDVALAGPYQGRRRMTLTYPAINRARQVLWVVTGAEKVQMLHRLLHCDADIPAGRVRCEKSLVLADAAAAGSPAATNKQGA